MAYKLVLASESPRRSELLKKAGFQFKVHPSKISETLEENLNVEAQILALAVAKARATFAILPSTMVEPYVILASDTMVVLDNQPLGKPTSVQDAIKTLRLLSGKSHFVKTSVCLTATKALNTATRELSKEVSFIETTEVWFRPLSEDEIQAYVATGEPLDKAGSYGIQGAGGQFVEKIEGEFANVMGLPISKVSRVLQDEFGIFPEEGSR